MRVSIRDGKLRLPLLGDNPNIIDTGFVPARFYSNSTKPIGEVAVHPSINKPGAGIFTVALATSGLGLMHLPSKEEAECFTLELLKEFSGKGIMLDFGPAEMPPTTRVAITFFRMQWHERRKLALPAHLAKTEIPVGIVITGAREP
jgi:hypothetical protein